MKSFLEYISEGKHYSFIKDLAKDMILDLKSAQKSAAYSLIKEYEFLQPKAVDLRLFARWETNPDLKKDQHFNKLTWEVYNFSEHGYCINAITKFSEDEYRIPEIDIFIVISGDNESVYSKIYPRLLGIVGHEVRHLKQIGINKEPFMGRVSTREERASSQKDYKYFLLPEEMDSMVEDKYLQAMEENRPIDEVIYSYLLPFVKDGFMSEADFKKVYITWIRRAIEFFPDANFSKKSQKIIDKI